MFDEWMMRSTVTTTVTKTTLTTAASSETNTSPAATYGFRMAFVESQMGIVGMQGMVMMKLRVFIISRIKLRIKLIAMICAGKRMSNAIATAADVRRVRTAVIMMTERVIFPIASTSSSDAIYRRNFVNDAQSF